MFAARSYIDEDGSGGTPNDEDGEAIGTALTASTAKLAARKQWMVDHLQLRGKVVVEFRMHFDGRVTDVKVNDADVGELYSLFCQKAIQDPAPYPRWPSDMRRQLQADYRDVRFSFFYN